MVKAVRMVGRFGGLTAAIAVLGLAGGCTALRSHQGYIIDADLVNSVQPGVDNRTSVIQTLGKPSFASQFNNGEWYYVARDSRNLAYEPQAKSQVTLNRVRPAGWCRTSRAPASIGRSVGRTASPRRWAASAAFRGVFGNIGSGRPAGAGTGGGDDSQPCKAFLPSCRALPRHPRNGTQALRRRHLLPNPCSNLTDAFATGSVSPSNSLDMAARVMRRPERGRDHAYTDPPR